MSGSGATPEGQPVDGERPTVSTACETQSPAEAGETLSRPASSYLWAMLLARIYEYFPLRCSQCGAEMQIIAFVTESGSIQRLLQHIGEPTTPPEIASARAPTAILKI